MRIIVSIFVLVGFLSIILFCFIAFVAFSDAFYRCPGMQCRDAIDSGLISLAFMIFGAIVVFLGLRYLRSSLNFKILTLVKFFNVLLVAVLLLFAAAVILFNLYVVFNSGNHTGIPIRLWGYKFLGFGIVAAIPCFFISGTTRKLLFALSSILTLFAANLLVFHYFGIMMEYSDWINSDYFIP